jgi:formamidopyrimidine-DNA glycosylase
VPELPEVETVRRGLAPVMEGARIVRVEARRPDLRVPFPPDFAARLEGQTIIGLGRRAKYLMADLGSGDVLVMHLGMSGSFRVSRQHENTQPGAFHHAKPAAPAHDHVVFHLSSGMTVTFNDPRRFGLMLIVPRSELAGHPLMREVGPEPLGNAFDASLLAAACASKKTSLKAALLDQTVVAGLGNIYVCEALHRAELSPRRRASTIATRTRRSAGAFPHPLRAGKGREGEQRARRPRSHVMPNARAVALVNAIKAVLLDAIKAGGSSLRDHRQTNGELGYFQHRFRVYDREGMPCVTEGCSGVVKRIVQNGRSTFFCPVCQR